MLLDAFGSPWGNLFQVKEVRQCSHVDFPCAVGSPVSVGLLLEQPRRMLRNVQLLRVFRDWELGWFVGSFCWWFLVQVGVWIDAGSRYETEKNNGAGYFLEHLAFKVSLMKSMIPLSVDRLSQRPEFKKLVSWLWNFWDIIAGYAIGKEQYGLSFFWVFIW